MVLRAGFGFCLLQFLVVACVLLSRDVAHFYGLPLSILTLVLEVPAVKHAHTCIICYMLEFPSTFMKLCHACEELQSNAKNSRFRGYFIDVKNTHECLMKFDRVRFSLMHVRDICINSKFVKYWYKLFTRCEELVPILHGVKLT